jgi:excisionase family DNA binding protein
MQTQLPMLYLRPQDVLEMLPVSRRTLSNWQRRRVIPFYRVGRIILFKRCDIEEALERFRVAAIGEPRQRATGKKAIQV